MTGLSESAQGRSSLNLTPGFISSLASDMLARVLLSFSYKQQESTSRGATANYNLENCLDFAKETIPNFLTYIQGKRVLDYGCGLGWQTVKMALSGADFVTGVDIDQRRLKHARELASVSRVGAKTKFTSTLPKEQFEVTVSLCCFEHYADPQNELRNMVGLTDRGGLILLAFAEPWFSHSGSHMNDFFKIPWVNLLFPEKAVLQARCKYRQDGAERYEEIVGGLNRMSVSRFERIIRQSGLRVVHKRVYPTRALPVVVHVPVIRELLTYACACVLEKQGYRSCPEQPRCATAPPLFVHMLGQ